MSTTRPHPEPRPGLRARLVSGLRWVPSLHRTCTRSRWRSDRRTGAPMTDLAQRLRDENARLQRRITEVRAEQRTLADSNDKLSATLRDARDKLAGLRQQIEELRQPPLQIGMVTDRTAEDDLVDVIVNGRRLRVRIDDELPGGELTVGRQVLLDETAVAVGVLDLPDTGELATIRELMPADDATGVNRVRIQTRSDEERVMRLAADVALDDLTVGDTLLIDRSLGLAWSRVERQEVENLVLEEIPDVTWHDIGGLEDQIEQVRDSVELPFQHRDVFQRYGLAAPKGVLLYGPPGCGKTMIAKAVARSLSGEAGRSYFLNIKGPELLNKYVGETERQIRLIFGRAKERAQDGVPVIVFFDEMDSLFRTRGTGVSSDVESTVVPQLLSELDGVEQLSNVIVIGASNREDLIDPAILRPGRLDVKIRLDRPDADAARDIFSKYLTSSVPLHPSLGEGPDAIAAAIDAVVSEMYATDDAHAFVRATYSDGRTETWYNKDFVSGAMINNIVRRAKKMAIKEVLTGGEDGVRLAHLMAACRDEFAENEDLPDTSSPAAWARISGRREGQVVALEVLRH
ncbi:proteasome ATPase [Parenemella sanctibonifatiensis]|uniref:AAA ATPase forming ring-shaped complexes n=2 Tax=Parenemella sanctibonifatiensis TaxID=2016505 RepID=A0A255EHR6_9ACTN|nr:proteasome ATPase [Parenemella sanctibonifatiensis]